MAELTSKRLEFWDSRSSLGFAAGSGDTNLKQLEIRAILESLGQPSTVLDAGCGNGYTIASLATCVSNCHFFGFDYSQGMVDAAKELMNKQGLNDRVSIYKANLLNPLPDPLMSLRLPESGFDIVYTERSIINLDTLDHQVNSVRLLWNMVAPGGRLILCEAFLDGLREINNYRDAVGLDAISPPWHNRYLSLDELEYLLPDYTGSPNIVEFSGTYYFVSRVIHAKEALVEGREPTYDSSINKQSLEMPSLPLFGQSKLVIFEKL